MDAEILIAAYREEDARLRRLAAAFPLRRRREVPPGCQRSLTATLGHIAFWDGYAVDFYSRRLDGRETDTLTFQEFLARDAAEQQRWEQLPYRQALAAYTDTTRRLLDFLAARWEEMNPGLRDDFTIPLEHRRHHRKQLERGLDHWLRQRAARRLMTG